MNPHFDKYSNGLVPVIVQDAVSNKVLMLGFMNEEALIKTNSEDKVTFYSRSKQRLWTKGETSNNFLFVKEIINKYTHMDTISQKAIQASTGNHQVIGALVALFKKHQNTIENWIAEGNIKLTIPSAIKIISEGTGIPESEVLQATTEHATR